MSTLYHMQENNIDKGRLKIQITSEATAFPVEDASVRISYTGVPENTLEMVSTDSSGQTETLELAAPPVEYSLDERQEEQPYSEYTLEVTAPGFEPIQIAGTEILSGVTALQNIRLLPITREEGEQVYVIPAHTLFGNYPPKIPEAEIKPVNETGEIVLSRVVVPEYVVVHDGSPRDTTALNYYDRYKDYIKNVASSEIYATWPVEAIKANVLAIMSFTLNRVYTEWYRNQGFDFTISSSTAFDHKWIPRRNIYDTISSVVDDLFASYLSRPNVRQPILTQYCDGKQVSCPGWRPNGDPRVWRIRDTRRFRSYALSMEVICTSTRPRRSQESRRRGQDIHWRMVLLETRCFRCRSSLMSLQVLILLSRK